jgi:hypothetical protein
MVEATMKRINKRHHQILSIAVGCGALILASGLLCAVTQTDKVAIPSQRETLIKISANNQIAWVLCFGKDPVRLDEIYFKGPSGEKIKVSMLRNFFPGYITEYSYVNDSSVLKSFVASGFPEQNLPIPVIYSMNGKLVAGLGDGGSREADLNTAFLKEFNKLPMGFQQGLRDLFLFGFKATPGVSRMADNLLSPLGDGLGLEPYNVDEVLETDLDVVKTFKSEFNKCDPK